jgi:hypothetical protein
MFATLQNLLRIERIFANRPCFHANLRLESIIITKIANKPNKASFDHPDSGVDSAILWALPVALSDGENKVTVVEQCLVAYLFARRDQDLSLSLKITRG